MAVALASRDIRFEPWKRPTEHTTPSFSWQEWAERGEHVRSLQNEDIINELDAKRRPLSNTDVTFQMEAILKQVLTMEVDIPFAAPVREYLLRYSDITNLIPRVCRTAKKHLGKDTQLSLEVYRDQEIEDEYLALYVRQESYDERLMDKIEEVCVEYEDLLSGKLGWLVVTTDFRPPH